MNCLKCVKRVKCMYTREGVNGRVRRYVCNKCGGRFTTLEKRAASDSRTISMIPDEARLRSYKALFAIEDAVLSIRKALDE